MTSTPPFLLWALEYHCPIRGFQDGSDPERTERHLRSAIATSDARRDDRIFEGYAIDDELAEPLAFRIDEALALYGGLPIVEQTCGHCPANALAIQDNQTLAGCVGMFVLPAAESHFYDAIERAIEKLRLHNQFSQRFAATQPKWFGLWIESPITTDRAGLLTDVIQAVKLASDASESFDPLLAGLSSARDKSLPFHATLYPRGTIENHWWRLATHCPRCQADWKTAGRGQCPICSYQGHPAPDKKRRARGRRPYLPLARLMGDSNAAEFLKRYHSRLQ